MPIKQFVMLPENMPEMRMETVSVKYMSTPRKVSGPSFAHGYVHIVEYVKKDCPSIWASLNSYITLGAGEKPCWPIYLKLSWLRINGFWPMFALPPDSL